MRRAAPYVLILVAVIAVLGGLMLQNARHILDSPPATPANIKTACVFARDLEMSDGIVNITRQRDKGKGQALQFALGSHVPADVVPYTKPLYAYLVDGDNSVSRATALADAAKIGAYLRTCSTTPIRPSP